jgi:beta-N-acetylhexosaminidase
VEPDQTVPATLSRRVLTGLLREDLGHEGLVVTDCLEMAAVSDGAGNVQGAGRAITAGADAVVVSHTPDRQLSAIEAVLDAVRNGRIPESRVTEAARRVLALKQRLVVGGGRVGSATATRPTVEAATSAVEAASRRVARRPVTVDRRRRRNRRVSRPRLPPASTDHSRPVG